ncbi:hypothetical protein AB6D30_10995 [Pectobacterium brasiliense]|uniref:hypothetical protein n=1 Tax=Pectobacterium brasiliense TaxID=180957 RepID=UPI0039862C4E
MENEDMLDYVARAERLSFLEKKTPISPSAMTHLRNLLNERKYEEFDTLLEVIDSTIKNRSKKNDNNLLFTSEFSQLVNENKKTREDIKTLSNLVEKQKRDINQKDDAISILQAENNELKGSLQQNRIDSKIPNYVSEVKKKLNDDDDFFIRMSNIWSICGSLFCITAIVFAFLTFNDGVKLLLDNPVINKISIFYLFTRGLLGIALLSWLSYTCFSNSRKYTHESIRRKDRQHALMFGQIFLQIYGSTASKEDAINVFKDWNMSGDTAFSGKTEQPPSVHGLLAQMKNMLPTKSDKSRDTTKKEDNN